MFSSDDNQLMKEPTKKKCFPFRVILIFFMDTNTSINFINFPNTCYEKLMLIIPLIGSII